MKLVNLRNAITSRVGRQVLQVQKVSPTILFGVGIVGVVGATVLACRATLKIDDVLVEAQDQLEQINTAEELKSDDVYSNEDAKKDRIVVHVRTGLKIARLYAPAVAVGVIGVASLTGSHVILNRRNVALTAAYAALDKSFRQYRARVVEKLGEDEERELNYDFEERNMVNDKGNVVGTRKEVIKGLSPYAVCFQKGASNNWDPRPGHNQMFIQVQQNWANLKLQQQGHLFLNEVYDMLGLERTPAGQIVGWVRGQADDFVDFGVLKNNPQDSARFLCGDEQSVWLDFNVDGVVYDKIGK